MKLPIKQLEYALIKDFNCSVHNNEKYNYLIVDADFNADVITFCKSMGYDAVITDEGYMAKEYQINYVINPMDRDIRIKY